MNQLDGRQILLYINALNLFWSFVLGLLPFSLNLFFPIVSALISLVSALNISEYKCSYSSSANSQTAS